MNTQTMQKIGFIYASLFFFIILVAHVPVLLNTTAPWEIVERSLGQRSACGQDPGGRPMACKS